MIFKQISLILSIFFLFASGLPKSIEKKVYKEIKEVFNEDGFVLNQKFIPEDLVQTLPSTFDTGNLFEIKNDDLLLGYAYVAKAASKTDTFDYLVLLDSDLIIVNTKVLIYRENYGGEIGSKRWLSQFQGKTQNDELHYGNNIAAISGATISVRSMTNAINNLLKSIKILHEKNII